LNLEKVDLNGILKDSVNYAEPARMADGLSESLDIPAVLL
jgi:hypothetical protein